MYDKPYRVSDEDAQILGESLKAIREAVYALSRVHHQCMEQHCEYCNGLDDLAFEIEGKLRRVTDNPICRVEAEQIEQFLAKV